jgi:cell division protein FtsQ
VLKVNPDVLKKRQEEKARRRRRRLNLIIALLFLAVVAESVYLASQSKIFNVRHIIVEGNRRVSEERILELSGISSHSNILKISTRAAEKKIMQEVWLRKVRVRREFPLDITISVRERQPLAVVTTKGFFLLVDEEGKILQSERSNIFPNFAVIGDLRNVRAVAVGQTIKSPALTNALFCLKRLQGVFATPIVSVSAPSIDGLSFQLGSGLIIQYGAAELVKQKNYAIKVILAESDSRGEKLKYIDVRVPSNPAAMPEQ